MPELAGLRCKLDSESDVGQTRADGRRSRDRRAQRRQGYIDGEDRIRRISRIGSPIIIKVTVGERFRPTGCLAHQNHRVRVVPATSNRCPTQGGTVGRRNEECWIRLTSARVVGWSGTRSSNRAPSRALTLRDAGSGGTSLRRRLLNHQCLAQVRERRGQA
jgi:hypothetical protein